MKTDLIVRMAQEAGMSTLVAGDPRCQFVERFAALVAAAQRAVCANELDAYRKTMWISDSAKVALIECASDMRARAASTPQVPAPAGDQPTT